MKENKITDMKYEFICGREQRKEPKAMCY